MPAGLTRDLPIAVCAAVIQQRGEILLTKRPEHKPHGGFWEFPGGKIDRDESPQASLRRELREELAIDIVVGPLLQTVFHRYNWGSVLIIVYSCDWAGGEIKHLEVAEHQWVRPSELEHYRILPADQPIISRLGTLYDANDSLFSSK